MRYLAGKLEAVRTSGSRVWAEMGHLEGLGRPCVIVSQFRQDNRMAVVLAEVRGDRISRLDVCVVPDPDTALATGEYPGIPDAGA